MHVSEKPRVVAVNCFFGIQAVYKKLGQIPEPELVNADVDENGEDQDGWEAS